MRHILTGALFVALAAGTASAGTIYTQALDASLGGMWSNTGGQVIKDDFSVSQDATITGVTWYGYYGSDSLAIPTSVEFDVIFYTDDSGAPSSTAMATFDNISASRSDSGSDSVINTTIYEFTGTLSSSVSISGGSTFWISIADDDASTAGGSAWQWI